MLKKEKKRGTKQKKRKQNSSCSDSVGTRTYSEVEMEITQDMIDFFAKSAQHRRSRDEAKKGEQGKTEPDPDHINVEQGVSPTEVQWKGLFLGKPPYRSRCSLYQVKEHLSHYTVRFLSPEEAYNSIYS
ncbi:hypothetical protein DPMN_103942 [Dreissena polymorpha]|uniref:Uncharacterized protein n=1 Tax=Dreissena polymorpha TaxID=45954 RepID=A0A9D4HC24_DREPO|nr:hypothetical protein DPMN_103942 [Dreissena polymorpha]